MIQKQKEANKPLKVIVSLEVLNHAKKILRDTGWFS